MNDVPVWTDALADDFGKDVAAELTGKFLQMTGSQIVDLAEASGSARAALAHSICGAARMVGAVQLADACKVLQLHPDGSAALQAVADVWGRTLTDVPAWSTT